jgi:SNF family Na+-dependent transporter
MKNCNKFQLFFCLRFPYLAYSSGGGAFLIPFLVSSIIVGIPYALLEVALGQWMREGGIGAWDITPILKGIGFANLIIVFLGNVYYEVILAWALRYLFASFNLDLPWKSCQHEWNTKCCSESLIFGNATLVEANQTTLIGHNVSMNGQCVNITDPITEYWE